MSGTSDLSMQKDGPSGDLKRSKAELLRAAAKLLGVLALAIGPAIGVWVDTQRKQAEALTATATESAASDLAYEKLAGRLNKMEESMRRLSVEVAAMQLSSARAAEVEATLGMQMQAVRDTPPPLNAVLTSSSTTAVVVVETAQIQVRAPVPKLSTARPRPSVEEVKAAKTRIEQMSKGAEW